jgi:two-component system phosphate regulon response regulator PhoB
MTMSTGEVVLLVNDIPDHVAAYQRALRTDGFDVRLARTGKDALMMMKESIPECAVIDLRLPDMSGWDLCREMKEQHTPAKEMPIVVLTPDVSKMCAADSARAGCDAWLAHPKIAEDLVRTVRRVLELESASPESHDAALLDLIQCVACGSDNVRPTLRMGPIQYFCCKGCGFCWRVEALKPSSTAH